MASDHPAATSGRKWYQRLGPGLITACVVIGPGSILTSSKVGAANGYALTWVVVVAEHHDQARDPQRRGHLLRDVRHRR